MAEGVIQVVVLNGKLVPLEFNVISSNGQQNGNLTWMQALMGADLINPASYSNPLPVGAAAPYLHTPVGFQQITAATLVTAQTLTVPNTATFALIGAQGGDVTWRDDGAAAPTATVGQWLYDSQPPQLFAGDLATLAFIKAVASPNLNISYYK